MSRSVSLRTVGEHVDGKAPSDWSEAWFCAARDCAVVYFGDGDEPIHNTALRTEVFQKGSESSRLVCYCFGHSVEQVVAAGLDADANQVVGEITQACRSGLDRCEEANPQGRCCLGNVRGLLRASNAAPSCQGCE